MTTLQARLAQQSRAIGAWLVGILSGGAIAPLAAYGQLLAPPLPEPETSPAEILSTEIANPTPANTETDTSSYPAWEILVLIYTQTEFVYTDDTGVERHGFAQMDIPERLQAAATARLFFEYDVPLLTSGMQTPVLTIRYPDRALTQLGEFCGHWPDKLSTAEDLDPAFDSVIVIWDDEGTDLLSNEPIDLMQCGGLNLSDGVGQTYSVFPVSSSWGSRNILKHEWGHAILDYFHAAGSSPEPKVNNHINDTDTQYVNCLTGLPYRLEDESANQPIPNSIYNNQQGFTHDYYSGQTATPDQPQRCLGITSDAWASPPPTQQDTLRSLWE